MTSEKVSNPSEAKDRRNHDIFISYSRRNRPFVEKLYAALKQKGIEAWVDWENIPAAVEWRPEIFSNIEAADNFVFIISPASVKSEVCNEELNYALQYKKRLIPILYESTDSGAVHRDLAKINWIFFREEDDFDAALEVLITSIQTDLDHVRRHTRLLVRAREWEGRARDSSFLLRKNDLAEAEHWLRQFSKHIPQPTELQYTYIKASREEEMKQQEAELTLRKITPQEYRNRQALLTKVKQFWVKNVLEASLHGQALIELGLDDRSDAIAHPWEMTWAAPTESPSPLPKGIRVIDLFDQLGVGHTLLILGDPGSGKTTTLLELARDLIGRAEQDLDQLMPVVFNLSSWMGGKQTVSAWLIEELNSKYQIPRKIGGAWVSEQKLLLLLDGLDEVQRDRQAALAA